MEQAKQIIAIGGSAGSYDLILAIMETLPLSFSQAICCVIHRNPNYETQIETSLSEKLNRNIISVIDKTTIKKNNIYFAPPGYHLLVEPDYTFSLDTSEPVNYSRPSIDVLFETAAEIYRNNCMAILLSGANTDGSKGITKILENGGKAWIQNPDEAAINTMPLHGMRRNPTASIRSTSDIISYFSELK
ncbi:MAG TPA: chemotaxis protein CheB [Sphingobacterium sp.]|nr:chemotaxis protein CheB [Sphingobacterium sp.]